MCARRAQSSDKYREQFNFYQIAKPPLRKGGPAGGPSSKVKEIEEFLRWAIEKARPGFEEGETIGVAAAASGVGASRATVGHAIDGLVKLGMLEARSKAPYLVISRTPRLDESVRLGGQTMSIATALRGRAKDHFDQLIPVGESRKPSRLRKFIEEQIDITPGAPKAISGKSRWRRNQDEVLAFRRLRVANKSRRPFLFEVSFICIDPRSAEGVSRQLEAIRELGAESLSMFALLEQGAGIRGFVAGRTRLTISPVEDSTRFLLDELEEGIPGGAARASFASDKHLLKWSYGIFVPSQEDPLVILATAYVDTDELSVFVKTLEVEL